MKKGFYTIMSAQFLSSLADNALFVVAVNLLHHQQTSEWQRAALVPLFALFYVILAPFVGAFADSKPKGRVMLLSNSIKIIGCLMMLCSSHPLLAYAVVGLGAAAYSPAKYGILTELLPPQDLVKANGWIEGLTIASIILGVLLGGQLIAPWLYQITTPFNALLPSWLDSSSQMALLVLMGLYMAAACVNAYIPLTNSPLLPMPSNPLSLLPDFWSCHLRLWKDKLGQISLSTTTLLWGVSGNLRYIVLAWAAMALAYDTTQGSLLVGVVAIGTAIGAILASVRVHLEHATRLISLGIIMGAMIIAMVFISDLFWAIPFLILLGALGGFLVVPMNALLQHRGHMLMGSGRSIAVQNFNEQACILTLGFLYTSATGFGISALSALVAFGLLVMLVMLLIYQWHASHLKKHPQELERLYALTRSHS